MHIFYFRAFLCNRITDSSLELTPVLEKMYWGSLQTFLEDNYYSVLLPGFFSFSSVQLWNIHTQKLVQPPKLKSSINSKVFAF